MVDARAAAKKRELSPHDLQNFGHSKAAAAPSSAGEEELSIPMYSFETRLFKTSSPLSRLLYLTKAVGVGIYMLAVMAYVAAYVLAHMYWQAIKYQVKGK